MKVYVVNTVVSDGYSDGSESNPAVFCSKEDALNYAYEEYVRQFEGYKFETGKDENDCELLSREEFDADESNYIVIQGHDSHVQVELYEREIDEQIPWIQTDDMQWCKPLGNHEYRLIEANSVDDDMYAVSVPLDIDLKDAFNYAGDYYEETRSIIKNLLWVS